jgi:hypothetical protein
VRVGAVFRHRSPQKGFDHALCKARIGICHETELGKFRGKEVRSFRHLTTLLKAVVTFGTAPRFRSGPLLYWSLESPKSLEEALALG